MYINTVCCVDTYLFKTPLVWSWTSINTNNSLEISLYIPRKRPTGSVVLIFCKKMHRIIQTLP